jgi:membrane associated rhomboid family serine protease
MQYRTRSSTMSFGFPPFRGAVKWLVISNIAIYFAMLLLGGIAPGIRDSIKFYGWLDPLMVLHGPVWQLGRLWQLITYAFLHDGIWHVLMNMFGLWMFGSTLEIDWGRRKFTEYFFWCAVGAALTTIAVGYAGLAIFRVAPSIPLFHLFADVLNHPTLGASGGLFGILIAYGILYPNREFFIFPLPFMIKAKYIVTVWILIAVAGALGEGGGGGIAHFAHLGGALFGWIYLRFLPRRGLEFAMSENFYGIRNRYYRWKRRRAARKFEVYMRKQGNVPPIDIDRLEEQERAKRDGDQRGPWVN